MCLVCATLVRRCARIRLYLSTIHSEFNGARPSYLFISIRNIHWESAVLSGLRP